ncbi:MAG: hypothetical protein GXO10_03450 [Crenarchaeota archaeon]|nr:hypothetical protein [Thermoproteota archaeon]
MNGRYLTLYMELIGGLDAIARLITMLRKCSTKAEVKEMSFKLNGSIVMVEMRVITPEPEWFTSKLSSIYEVQEISIKENVEPCSSNSRTCDEQTVEMTSRFR